MSVGNAEHEITPERLAMVPRVRALLMFQDGGARRKPDKDTHTRVVTYIWNHMQHEQLVYSLIQRDITGFDDPMEAIARAEDLHPGLRGGLL